MTLSSRDLCAIATVQPKLDAARAMLAALQELHAFSVERDRLDCVLTRARTLKAEQAIALAKAAGIKAQS